MRENKSDKTYQKHILITAFGILTLTLLILAGIAGAASFAYVVNGAGDYPRGVFSVIDTASNTETVTIPGNLDGPGVAVSPDGTKVYVANEFSNNVSVCQFYQ